MITLTREEAQQVLDALIWTTGSEDFSETGKARVGAIKVLFPAIETLRTRLSAPEPEPVAWVYPDGLEALKNGKCWTAYGTHQNEMMSPLYTAPPQREWRGLTDEEILNLMDGTWPKTTFAFARSIEQALREKNT